MAHRLRVAVGHVGDLGMNGPEWCEHGERPDDCFNCSENAEAARNKELSDCEPVVTNMVCESISNAFARGEKSGAEKERAVIVAWANGFCRRMEEIGLNSDRRARDLLHMVAKSLERGDHLPKGTP